MSRNIGFVFYDPQNLKNKPLLMFSGLYFTVELLLRTKPEKFSLDIRELLNKSHCAWSF